MGRDERSRMVKIATRLAAADGQLQKSLVELQQKVRVGGARDVLQLKRVFLQIVHLDITLQRTKSAKNTAPFLRGGWQ